MAWAEEMGYDGYCGDDLFDQKYWITKDKKFIKPQDMTRSHRLAVIAMVARNQFDNNEKMAIASVTILQKMHKCNLKELTNG